MVSRYLYTVEYVGSIPTSPTISFPPGGTKPWGRESKKIWCFPWGRKWKTLFCNQKEIS